MSARSYPNGHATGALHKALLKYLDVTKGRGVADEWLVATRTERRDLEDEARAVPLVRLLGALQEFVRLTSRDAIDKAGPYLLLPENLGAWTRLLRGSGAPADAFDRLSAADTDASRTMTWETVYATPTSWSGRMHVAHDPGLEEDGLLRAARMVELSMVPMLFGLERGVVSSLEAVTNDGPVQEFEVRWQVPDSRRAVGLGVCVGGAASSVPFALFPSALSFWCLVAGACAGALAGMATGRERLRRVETMAQRTRVYALERSLLLRDQRTSAQSGTLEGTVVAGQYRIVRRMGSGGSGVIYEALRASDGLPVAIKLLRAVAAQDAVASDRLRREAEALGLAWHPNVVDVLEHGHLPDGTSYLVMELLRGETLAARLDRSARLTSAELVPIALQVCDALVAVHAAGVVHRDLKPSNIFLTEAPPPASGPPVAAPARVKLIDFGIARVEWAETRITNMGAPVGTPGYMSPEQEAGGEIDARSDVFAFGAVMHECLVGSPPPPRKSSDWPPPSAQGDASERVPKSGSGVHAAIRTLPPAWQVFLSVALAQDPRDRFADARTMLAALREVEPGVAEPALPAAAKL